MPEVIALDDDDDVMMADENDNNANNPTKIEAPINIPSKANDSALSGEKPTSKEKKRTG
jgi:hypothetical protein